MRIRITLILSGLLVIGLIQDAQAQKYEKINTTQIMSRVYDAAKESNYCKTTGGMIPITQVRNFLGKKWYHTLYLQKKTVTFYYHQDANTTESVIFDFNNGVVTVERNDEVYAKFDCLENQATAKICVEGARGSYEIFEEVRGQISAETEEENTAQKNAMGCGKYMMMVFEAVLNKQIPNMPKAQTTQE